MSDLFYLYFPTMPKGTAQQKGVMVRNGKPIFYRKDNVQSARNQFIRALKPHKPKNPSEKPIKLYLWFAFDVKDKKKWGKYKPTMPDVDNIAKEFIDAMVVTGFFAEDAQVCRLSVDKTYAEKASICVKWEELNNDG